MSQPLDPLTLPLWGSRLIEASAGTGKTWTIAVLYLRLVLGHGDREQDHGFGRPLIPSEILVMTFTRAATRELSDRIRARLLEAARCFRGEAQARDPLMTQLLDSHPEGAARANAAWRLATAAESMDEAAVHTIDAWCQRMLREHAFDSGCLFDEELTGNELGMVGEAAQDYWRQQVYPLAGEALDTALAVWKDIATLVADARALKDQVLPVEAGKGSLADCIAQALAEQQAVLAPLKVGWAERARTMLQWLDGQTGQKTSPFNGNKLRKASYAGWLTALAAWAESPALVQPDINETGRNRLIPQGMQDALKAGCTVEFPEGFAAFETLLRDLAEVPVVATRMRLHAAVQMQAQLAALKKATGSFGFADMLTRLDHALDPEAKPDAAERLRKRILTQYPVALIDEFQDTAPVQARIFERLYRLADNDRQAALLLIGDPKQSIYGFRGADIHSYLKARKATAGRHYVLDTNHRSTASVVAAVNHLLHACELRGAGEGAFRYRSPPGMNGEAAENPLPFLPVQARGRDERFREGNIAVPAITLAIDTELRNKNGSMRAFAARCAERITCLLNDPDTGFEENGKPPVRLTPADIAILVRTGKEAATVQRELQRRGVASVYLSDQQSVFASAEAQDLLHWLRAVASPLDARLVRSALATQSVGLSLDELMRLADDDEVFDARSEQLRQLRNTWQLQGVLAMLRRTLHMLELPGRWLSASDGGSGEGDGERRLTNFLHLAELLQTASAQLEGEQALVRWLAEQVQGETQRNDDHVVRLESDSDLVKVVTVHASKGLEYPLVFLPFASGFRAVEKRYLRMLHLADNAGERTLHLVLESEHIEVADKERHREDLRLLYVGLTRARHAVWVGLAALKVGRSQTCQSHKSALGYLLHGETIHENDMKAHVEALIAGCADIVLQDALSVTSLACEPLRRQEALPALRATAPYVGAFERNWSIGSFSALVRDLGASGTATTSVAAVRDDERVNLALFERDALQEHDDHLMMAGAASGISPVAQHTSASGAPWHRFPRGALPGNFLHDQMEWLAAEGFDLVDNDERAQQLQRRCDRMGWTERGAEVLAWLRAVVATEIPVVGSSLDRLSTLLPEMEFWFPVDQLVAADLDALCREELLDGQSCPSLPERELKGVLMGFADLVFEHDGRYWVLDYKSNFLGEHDEHYTPQALRGAMAEHRYDVQGAVYLFALHRLLRTRLGEAYDPLRHLGGAVFFFLRGVHAPTRGCHHVVPTLSLLDRMDCLLSPTEEATA